MKKYLIGIFLGLIFILSFKLDSFAYQNTNCNFSYSWLYDNGEFIATYNYNFLNTDDNFRVCIVISDNQGTASAVICNTNSFSCDYSREVHYSDDTYSGNSSSGTINSNNYASLGNGVFRCGDRFNYYSDQNGSLSANVYVFNSYSEGVNYLSSGVYDSAINKDSMPFDSYDGSESIPTPVVNWVLKSDGTLSRTLQFTNAQLPMNPNIRMGLELRVHWASVDNITMSYSNQSASALGTGYSVFYDNALSQDGSPMGYDLPNSVSGFKPCPSEIDFITNTDSIALFNSFLTVHPVSERTITYSPSSISSFANAFRSHLGVISFEYNVPYVSCRYYYRTPDGNSLIYGGWTNTYPKLPSQGAVLSINKQNGQVIVPINAGTVNQGYDVNDNPIFDNSTVIESPDLVNFDDLNNSVHNMFSYLGQFPSFLAYLFPFLPSWIPILLASIIGTLLVIGLVRIILK